MTLRTSKKTCLRSLSIIRTLPTHLEMQPLLALEILLAASLIADRIVVVVLGDEVLDDSSRFPELEAAVVGIDERGEAAVRVELLVFGVLDVV